MDFNTFLRLWRNWIRLVVFVLYVVILCIALPFCIWQLDEKGAPRHVQAWFIGGLFVMMALPISLGGILQHVVNYTTPHLQKFIIRILWMVPIYGLNAWFALRFPAAAIYLDTLRECYEAYVIYNFMAYLLSFLNHEYPHLEVQVQNKEPMKFLFPLCLLPRIENYGKFVNRCKHGVLQYTVIRPLMTVIALICEMFDQYNEGDFDFKTAWSYIVIINNLSQVLAMYCLVLFYKAFKDELRYLNPVPKFMCVKAVVFLSFWQALVIAALAKTGVIPQNGPWIYYDNVKEVSTGIQDFCICIEMFFAALAHYFSFSHKPFVNLAAEQRDCCSSFLLMWDVRDVREDVVEHARYISRGMQKTLSRGARLANGLGSTSGGESQGDERTPLLTEASSSSQNSERFERSYEHMQSRKTPSPAELVEPVGGDDSYSAGGDSSSVASSRRRYGSLTAKSTTSSMYNYMEFDEGGPAGRPGLEQRRGHKHRGFEKSIEGAVIHSDEGRETVTVDNSLQNRSTVSLVGARPGDDVFEHLDKEDEADSSDNDNSESVSQQCFADDTSNTDVGSNNVKDIRDPVADISDSVSRDIIPTQDVNADFRDAIENAEAV